MKRYMDCEGFVVSEDMSWYMSELLSELQHLSPSDSYINACVKKELDNYFVEISIIYNNGEFLARAKDVNLVQAVQQGSDLILSQIEGWQKERFNGDNKQSA